MFKSTIAACVSAALYKEVTVTHVPNPYWDIAPVSDHELMRRIIAADKIKQRKLQNENARFGGRLQTESQENS